MGAAKIMVASRSSRRRELVLAFGADSYHSFEEDDPEEWARALAGSPPDVVAECVGQQDMLDRAIDLVRLSGTVVSLGMCMVPEPLIAARCAFKEVTMVFPIAFTIDDFEATLRALDAGRIRPEIAVSEIIGLDELPATIERLRSGARPLKIQVDPGK
jgi:(R,R)-butanediol dehydrogenase/meso-butanediol dehydrogenase/diacetyl reductase